MDEKQVEKIAERVAQRLLDEKFPVYGTIKDVPEQYRPTVRKLVENGSIQSCVEDIEDPEDVVLNISLEMCRILDIFCGETE